MLNNVIAKAQAAMAAENMPAYMVTSRGGKQGHVGWIRLPNPLAKLTDAEWKKLAAMLDRRTHESLRQRFFHDEMPTATQQQLPKPHGIVLMDSVNGKTVSQVSVVRSLEISQKQTNCTRSTEILKMINNFMLSWHIWNNFEIHFQELILFKSSIVEILRAWTIFVRIPNFWDWKNEFVKRCHFDIPNLSNQCGSKPLPLASQLLFQLWAELDQNESFLR